MANVNSVLTQTKTEFNQAISNSTAGTELGKEQFLQLLVTQLQYQDPLNPMEDQEFIAQMAQFSSLEQLMNLNTSMQGLTDATNNQQMFSATSYIGKYVTAVGNVIGKASVTDADGNPATEVTPLYYSFNAPTASGSITVRDSSGNVVYVESLEAKSSGTIFKFSWNGRNGTGATVADGTYTVSVTGIDANGEAVLCTPMVADKVTDILRDGSTIYLRLEGGQNMTLADVELVSSTRPTLATDGSEGSDTNTDTDADAEALATLLKKLDASGDLAKETEQLLSNKKSKEALEGISKAVRELKDDETIKLSLSDLGLLARTLGLSDKVLSEMQNEFGPSEQSRDLTKEQLSALLAPAQEYLEQA